MTIPKQALMPNTRKFNEAEVLKKAQEVFNERGYNGTSMDDLVKATGLSRSSIYDTFTDKHGLFMKTLEYYRGTQKNCLDQLLAKTNSPKKKIGLLFNSIINEIMTDEKKMGCLLLNASMELTSVDKNVAGVAYLGMEEMENRFYKWIKEGQASGEIAKRFPPKPLAKHLYNSVAGLRMTGRNRPDVNSLREIVRITLSILDE